MVQFPFLTGCEVVIQFEHDRGDNRRKHKKKRINKKWRKRYGVYTYGFEPMTVVSVDGKLYMSRRTYSILKAKVITIERFPHHGNAAPYHLHSDHFEGLRNLLKEYGNKTRYSPLYESD